MSISINNNIKTTISKTAKMSTKAIQKKANRINLPESCKVDLSTEEKYGFYRIGNRIIHSSFFCR